jgi:hypothetical protein
MALQVGTLKDNEFIQAQSAIMVYGLSLGWFVNVPDDGGVQGAFGKPIAMSSLHHRHAKNLIRVWSPSSICHFG